MPASTRKRKRSERSSLSLNRPVGASISEEIPLPPSANLIPVASEVTDRISFNVHEGETSTLDGAGASTMAAPPDDVRNTDTSGSCSLQQQSDVLRTNSSPANALANGDCEGKARKLSANSQDIGSNGDATKQASDKEFNVDLFVQSALSCGICKMPYSTVVSSNKPFQFKPCNHLACFSCIDRLLIQSDMKKVPLYKILCSHCNKKIAHITCNESVHKLIQAFIDAGVIDEGSSQNTPIAADTISDPSIETRKLEALSDFKLTRKTICQFPSASFDPSSLQHSESSSPQTPAELANQSESLASGGGPSVSTSSSTRIQVESNMTRNEAINVFLEHLDFLTSFYAFTTNSASQWS